MRYLGLALLAEGPTDYRFLPSVLYRLTEDVCLRHGQATVEVGPVMPLEPGHTHVGDRITQITEIAREAAGTYHVLFLHTDGNGDWEAAVTERFQPWSESVRGLGRADERSVAVVPVREMEAWAICDGEALRGAFGVSLTDRSLGIPTHAADVERLQDPKRTLEAAYAKVFRPRRPKRSAAASLEAIAERVRLDRLREVP